MDVNFQIDKRTNRIIMMGAMDNLVKGAAGQAVQNMNLMFGLKETKGLELVLMFPKILLPIEHLVPVYGIVLT